MIQTIEDTLRVCAMDFKGNWDKVEECELLGPDLLQTITSTMTSYEAITSQID